MTQYNVVPVILAGGSGTRLWPLSREQFPKQFIPLASDISLMQETIARLRGGRFLGPAVVCSTEHRFIVAEQLRDAHINNATIMVEPCARNTAIAIAAAAYRALEADPAAIMLVLPSDHRIEDNAAFHKVLELGINAAANNRLVTFGITPRFAATGYGYIQTGKAISGETDTHAITKFVEKPNQKTADAYLKSGKWLWNSGMFILPAALYLAELKIHAPDVATTAAAAFAHARRETDFIWLEQAAYAQAPDISVDYAVMEKTARAAVVPADIGWNDIGSWSALWDVGDKDASQNVLIGDVIQHDTKNCYIRSEQPLIATYGIEDTVVVAMPDVVLVASRKEPQKIKQLIEELRAQQRPELTTHRRVYRPWGYYESVAAGENFQIKRIVVRPGKRLSLQRHQHRSEHWVVVRGVAKVSIHDKTTDFDKLVHENVSVYIPQRAMHRLENPGLDELEIVEVQCGGYLGEDDIERFGDDWQRT